MKTEIKGRKFSDYLVSPADVIVGIVIVSTVCVALPILLIIAYFNGLCADFGLPTIFVISIVSILVAVGYPVLSVYAVKHQSKCPHLVKWLVKESYLK